jgi:hypothetical protein
MTTNRPGYKDWYFVAKKEEKPYKPSNNLQEKSEIPNIQEKNPVKRGRKPKNLRQDK